MGEEAVRPGTHKQELICTTMRLTPWMTTSSFACTYYGWRRRGDPSCPSFAPTTIGRDLHRLHFRCGGFVPNTASSHLSLWEQRQSSAPASRRKGWQSDANAEAAAAPLSRTRPEALPVPPPPTVDLRPTTTALPESTALLWLNAVAVLWGTQHAVIKRVILDTDPAVFTAVRFALAASLATLGLALAVVADDVLSESHHDQERDLNPSDTADSEHRPPRRRKWSAPTIDNAALVIRWGTELGAWMFLGFCFQAIGLHDTTAQKSGFLLYLNVKIVPFLAFVVLGRQISPTAWASAATALAGTFLLLTGSDPSAPLSSLPATTDTPSFLLLGSSWNVGDVWSVAAAFASAAFIVRLERASERVPDAAALNAMCLWTVAVLSIVWCCYTGTHSSLAMVMEPRDWWDDISHLWMSHPGEVLYLGGIATALSNWIQAKAQRSVPAERAAIMYALDPVYGAAFAYWLLGEELHGWTGWVGAGLIAAAALSGGGGGGGGGTTKAIAAESDLGASKVSTLVTPEDPK